MKFLLLPLVVVSVLGLAAFFASRPTPVLRAPRNTVLVELFTSEGCSSCPPADALLGRLAKTQDVVVLEEHVDYWNHLGWKDPFSDAFFSKRQDGYSAALKLDGVYTPQMVVDGTVQFVGSDSGQASEAIQNAGVHPNTAIDLNYQDSTLTVGISDVPAAAEVWLAITEDGLHSDVKRGENTGQALEHTAVVRQMTPIGSVEASASFSKKLRLVLKPEWNKDHLKAVVFMQLPGQGRVLGVASKSL